MTSLQLNDTLLRLAPVQEGTSASPRVSRYLVIHDGDEEALSTWASGEEKNGR